MAGSLPPPNTSLRQRLAGFLGRVFENLLAALVVVALLSGGVIGILQAAFGVLGGTVAVAVPAWTLTLGAVVVLGAVFVGGAWANRVRETNPAIDIADELMSHLELHVAYAEHIYGALDQLQDAVDGDIAGVTIADFIERGVLSPGRDMLKSNQPPGEDVRLSILRPDGADFVMAHSAGHTSRGHASFRIPIAGSFSRLAYEQGRVVVSPNVDDDPRFEPHPEAQRPYKTIVSFPLGSGRRWACVFNAVFTAEDAVDHVDYIYLALLVAVTNVALVADEEARRSVQAGL